MLQFRFLLFKKIGCIIVIKLQVFMAFVQVQPIWRQLKGQNRLIKVPPPNKTKLAMESSSSNGSNVPLPASQRPLHATDADEDESVKQLNECATIYLSLHALSLFPRYRAFPSTSHLFPSIPILGLSDLDLIIIVCRTASSSQTTTRRSAKHVGLLIRNIFSNKIC
jgi:hypothetical protein